VGVDVTAWDEVMATALVGTDRRPPAAHLLDEFAIHPGGPPESLLLSQAAVLAGRRLAGWVPTESRITPSPAPSDDRLPCSPRAIQVLELALQDDVAGIGGPATAVLTDWITAAAAARRRPPSHLVPVLLDLAVKRRDLRDPIVAVTGPLGRWLAERNPRWQRLSESTVVINTVAIDTQEAERRWATASRAERESALAQIRSQNPPRALQLLTDTWSGETAADRAGLLAKLSVGLSDADQAFLETVLDDRSRPVRAVAIALLERLPFSARAQRMTARLEPLVHMGKGRLDITLPDEPGVAARRDGLTDKGPSGIGTRGWWLAQLVIGTPLSWWSDKSGMSPADLLQAGAPNEVQLGWALAAERQGNAEWARLLFPKRRSPALLAALPPADAAALAETVVAPAAGKVTQTLVHGLLDAVEGPWPRALSEAAVARYRQADPFSIQKAAVLLGTRLDPAVAPLVEQWASSITDRSRRDVTVIHHTLTLRKTIAEEFA
jgi:hypothetical protein